MIRGVSISRTITETISIADSAPASDGSGDGDFATKLLTGQSEATQAAAPASSADIIDAELVDSAPPPGTEALVPSGDQVSQSRASDWLSGLRDLRASDPDKFKKVAAEISDRFGKIASDESGTVSSVMRFMADRFHTAATSGDLPTQLFGGQDEDDRGGLARRAYSRYRDGAAPASGTTSELSSRINDVVTTVLAEK